MIWPLILLLVFVLIAFSFVLIFGAPYLPTLRQQQLSALNLLELKPGQTLLELGSGDGRVLAVAASQGIRGIGYELNPVLFVYSKLRLRRYGDLVEVRFANFWNQKLPPCDGIYVFLLDRFMKRLHTKITQENSNNIKLVSFAFRVPGVDHVTERDGLYLYVLKALKS